jgi:hypothetical protein
MSRAAVDATLALLHLDPAERVQNVGHLKSMAMFKKIDFDHILEQEGPFVPSPDSECDTDYFEGQS